MDDKKHTVLIVDDEVHNIDVLCGILGSEYELKVAKNGRMAIGMALKHNPSLILLDVIMPDMTGFEVLEEFNKNDLIRDIPVIFITGMDSSEDEEKGLLLGAVDYIKKPFINSIVRLRVQMHIKVIEQMHTIEQLGMIDALTNISNRRCFDHQSNIEWNRAIREKTPISILMIDIDKFKDFNDKYGHKHGDMVLKGVADIIIKTLKRSGDLASRWGGEEFSVLLPNTALIGALEIAEQIRANIENLKISCINDKNAKVTISIGVNSVRPDVGSLIDDFISKADKALYAAKEAGRNMVMAIS